ncbi:hypothetical protein Taro_037694, partial [Colocasia esculenta]|nr:hypothetical protein [Colocasia esculenta]
SGEALSDFRLDSEPTTTDPGRSSSSRCPPSAPIHTFFLHRPRTPEQGGSDVFLLIFLSSTIGISVSTPSTVLVSSCSGGLDITPPAGVRWLQLLHDKNFLKSCRDEGRPTSWERGSWWTVRGGAYLDIFGNYYGGLSTYGLVTWRRLFLTQLNGPDDEPSDADDVAIDRGGNAYVTDAKSNKL